VGSFRTGAQIVVECALLACGLGIALDMVTAHVAVEYFTVYHPKVVESTSPIVMALVWGVGAAWWFGAIAGGFLAIVNARRIVPLAAAAIRPMVAKACVILWGTMMLILGSVFALFGMVPLEQRRPSYGFERRLMSVAITHMTEYALGAIAFVVVAVLVSRSQSPEVAPQDSSIRHT
jgi:hypothetical protein